MQSVDPTCAPEDQVTKFLSEHTLLVSGETSFIDFGKVKSKSETLHNLPLANFYKTINAYEAETYMVSLNEHKTELVDNRFNLIGFNEHKLIDYLVPDSNVVQWSKTMVNQKHGISILYSLSPKITIQKRKVYDAFMMFGDVGGLYDFFFLPIASFIEFFA